MAKKFRLYIPEDLAPDKVVRLGETQSHYLKNVVKYATGDTLSCFDNLNGEFSAEVTGVEKKQIVLKILQKIGSRVLCPDIWLLFAPLKKDRTDFVIEKATELGCRRIMPVITCRTISENVKIERYAAQSAEAAEQCRRTDLPEIVPPEKLENLLQSWKTDRTLFFMDETLNSESFAAALKNGNASKAAVLIGPEGGFAQKELTLLRALPFARGATLGPRILRAETAVVAALSCWQLLCGDWRNK